MKLNKYFFFYFCLMTGAIPFIISLIAGDLTQRGAIRLLVSSIVLGVISTLIYMWYLKRQEKKKGE